MSVLLVYSFQNTSQKQNYFHLFRQFNMKFVECIEAKQNDLLNDQRPESATHMLNIAK